jgi:PAS domain S-box-containing protein
MTPIRIGNNLLAEKKYEILSELMCDYAAAYHFTSDDNDQAQLEWVVGAFEEITGHPIPAARTNFRLSTPVHPDDLEEFLARQGRLRAGIASNAEFRIINKNGEIRWLYSRGLPEWDNDRQEAGRIYVGVEDITEKKQIQETYQTLVDKSFQGLLITQNDRIKFANKKASEIFGYPLADLLAIEDPISKLLHHDYQETAEEVQTEHLAGNPNSEGEFKIITRQGEEIWLHSISSLVTYQGQPAIQSTFIDITAKKQTEEKLAYAAAIIESSDDAIIGKDLDGTILSWNPGAERIYGYRAAEIIGKPISTLVPPNYPNDVLAILNRIRRGESVDHYETMRVRKDGRLLNISLTISPIRGDNGQIYGASVIARDITERKKIENTMRENEAQLRLITSKKRPLSIRPVCPNFRLLKTRITSS